MRIKHRKNPFNKDIYILNEGQKTPKLHQHFCVRSETNKSTEFKQKPK